MKRIINVCATLGLALTVASACLAAPAVSVKTRTGATWRGEINDIVKLVFKQQGVDIEFSGKLIKVGDGYVIVEGDVAGKIKQKTIFSGDIASMQTVSGTTAASAAPPALATAPATETTGVPMTVDISDDPAVGVKGVYLLPLNEMVGTYIRTEQFEEIAKEADKAGPGQIIILRINTNGGSAYESQKISDVIMDMKKRHRVIAWIHKAISAGCQIAMSCNEIYFMTEGTAGSVTTWDGVGNSIKGEDLERSMEHLAKIAEQSGYSKYIAYSMKTNTAMCSYDKDPVTGKVTWYGDMSGEFVLSDDKSNLCFNSSNALHSGFSKGTADTEEDLAKLLNMPRWVEVNDAGRKISENWERTVKQAEQELPLLFARYQYKNTGSGDAVVILGTRISIINDLIRWWDKCPNVAQMSLPPKEQLEREVAELRKQLADLQRQRRG